MTHCWSNWVFINSLPVWNKWLVFIKLLLHKFFYWQVIGLWSKKISLAPSILWWPGYTREVFSVHKCCTDLDISRGEYLAVFFFFFSMFSSSQAVREMSCSFMSFAKLCISLLARVLIPYLIIHICQSCTCSVYVVYFLSLSSSYTTEYFYRVYMVRFPWFIFHKLFINLRDFFLHSSNIYFFLLLHHVVFPHIFILYSQGYNRVLQHSNIMQSKNSWRVKSYRVINKCELTVCINNAKFKYWLSCVYR